MDVADQEQSGKGHANGLARCLVGSGRRLGPGFASRSPDDRRALPLPVRGGLLSGESVVDSAALSELIGVKLKSEWGHWSMWYSK